MNRTHMALAAAVVAMMAQVSSAADRNWSPTAAGTYDWNTASNWGGTVPTSGDTAKFVAPNGAQTITGEGMAGALDVNNGNPSKTREFAGDLTVGSFVFRQGVMNLTGSLSVTGSDGTYSRIGTSAKAPGGTTLQALHIYGKLSAPGAHALCVARGNDNDSNANGYLCLHDGGELTLNTTDPTVSMSGLMLARTSGSSEAANLNAAFVQEGGQAKIGRLMAGFETASRATVAVLDGVFELPFCTGTRFRIGHKGFGIFQQLGGTACVLTNCPLLGVSTAFRNDMFEIGGGELETSGARGAAFYACGGLFKDGGDFYVQGNPSVKLTAFVPAATATVDGDAVLDCYRLVIGANSTPGAAIVNVNGSARYGRRIKIV